MQCWPLPNILIVRLGVHDCVLQYSMFCIFSHFDGHRSGLHCVCSITRHLSRKLVLKWLFCVGECLLLMSLLIRLLRLLRQKFTPCCNVLTVFDSHLTYHCFHCSNNRHSAKAHPGRAEGTLACPYLTTTAGFGNGKCRTIFKILYYWTQQ